jgi:hypothetical protein
MENPPTQKSADEAREERDAHIFAQMLNGRAMPEIARSEGLSLRRVQQIVAREISKRDADPADTYRMLQIARLERALVPLERQIEDGRTAAVSAYVRVIEQLTKLAHKPLQLGEDWCRTPEDVRNVERRIARLAAARDILAERRTAALDAENERIASRNAEALDIPRNREIGPFPGVRISRA